MNALITGAGGFLGTWLARALAARGDQISCLLRPTTDTRELEKALAGHPWTRVVGDVTDPASLASAVKGVDVVFHLAGIRRAALRDEFMRVNAEGTRLICEAMAALPEPRPRLVMCGSLASHGPSTPERPHVEEDAFHPHEWYGESKAEAERIAFSFQDRLPVTVIRPPRILGPGDRENLTFFKLGKKGIRLELAGGPRPLSLVDVEDVVDLLLVLAEKPEALGEAFFCAGPERLTLEEMQDLGAKALGFQTRTWRLSPAVLTALASAADGVTRLTGRKLPLNRKLARQLLAPAWTCSGAKAERLLGFRPRRGLAESITRSGEWYRAQGWL
ncbi:NAD-dependent epimerase/dehydratase family protein [Corallococcus exiguus]|nr:MULTISPECIES: NAD-dependent epimerase/dehydratase family protein [Corallococcus]NNC21068.1 NAD-dependent epimerase/dehydratase family protein [Corallococcus exiguus]RKH16593.1 NAD-dependent epimerase/dehydratase family protein [Corallococcus sp. CA041A]RUO89535.1 NAD-dependent epimerase/dehydratase family protein [Corallococcus sp. AB018]